MTGANPREHLWLVGQDLGLARSLADRYVTVGGVIGALKAQIKQNRETARRLRPLGADAPLARELGTRYPLLQGPMTRVSDTVAFAESVADAGALPFLALALLRGPECETLLAETKLSNKGIGFLIIQAYSVFDMPSMYAMLIVLFALAIGANALIGRLGGIDTIRTR